MYCIEFEWLVFAKLSTGENARDMISLPNYAGYFQLLISSQTRIKG